MAPRSELTPALRERICELHSAAHWGYKRIQKRYPFISVSTVRYTIKKDHERLNGVSKPRSGRPRKLTEADHEWLLTAIHENPKITREDMLTEVSNKVNWRPYLTEEYAIKRLRWALQYQHYTPEDWARVFWSDKCTVKRRIGVQQEWTFIRPRDQPKTG
ncbi:uncharacterized protein N7459_001832 [Penicillium hispanicum]|uniref:uncharacterized protein n=1 Tax=Penicillium hispanicum TaxID=1080232 RepID=UPI002541A235|nr:uncharacterized protein N7459_001832 [Penicillium hispanicum]KAJ5591463.1 hypothetical protein N7459_001832 [Penicillium hispanicum]